MRYIFIINPDCGIVDKTEQIRAALAQREDIDAIVFNTEEAGQETFLMKEMLDIFDDEKVRICICGGSGTLSNAVDAIDMNDMEHVEVAYYPCGLTNDFLKNFGDQASKFESLYEVIDGNTKPIDFMRCVVDGNAENVRNELLFATVGIAANIENIASKLKVLGEISPSFLYGVCTLISMPFSPSVEYELIIDGKDYSRDYKMIYVANSLCLGGRFVPITSDISCTDGYINVLLIRKIPSTQFLTYMTEFMHGKLKDNRPENVEIIKCKEMFVRRKDGKSMNINADGEIHSSFSWNIKVVSGRLQFVLPNGVDFIDNPEKLIKGLGLC